MADMNALLMGIKCYFMVFNLRGYSSKNGEGSMFLRSQPGIEGLV